MADRFTYVAALPLSILVAGAVARLLVARPRRQVLAAGVACAACLALLAGLTVRQLAVWRDDVSLWSRPIELEPRRSGRVYTQRSMAREVAGDLAGARADMDPAIELAAARRFQRIDMLYERRGGLVAQLGAVEEAIADYGRALETQGSPDRRRQLKARAALHRAVGRTDLAGADEQAAERLPPAR